MWVLGKNACFFSNLNVHIAPWNTAPQCTITDCYSYFVYPWTAGVNEDAFLSSKLMSILWATVNHTSVS